MTPGRRVATSGLPSCYASAVALDCHGFLLHVTNYPRYWKVQSTFLQAWPHDDAAAAAADDEMMMMMMMMMMMLPFLYCILNSARSACRSVEDPRLGCESVTDPCSTRNLLRFSWKVKAKTEEVTSFERGSGE